MRGRYRNRRHGRPVAPAVGPLVSKSGVLFYYSYSTGRTYFLHPTRGWKSEKYNPFLHGRCPEVEAHR